MHTYKVVDMAVLNWNALYSSDKSPSPWVRRRRRRRRRV